MSSLLEGGSWCGKQTEPRAACRVEWVQHERQLADFIRPLFDFVDGALAKGENVMVHCLAGAHRAGTSGVALAMYYLRLSAVQGTMFVKERRPIVDPIGSFPELLKRLDAALQDLKKINALVEKEKLAQAKAETARVKDAAA